ncbi:F-box protein PP2-B1-like [Carex rostrata]
MADSDFLWKDFLPSDYATILSRTVDPVVFTSKKDLFFQLSNRHVLIDGGKMSFGLDRGNGAKCYMLSTSMLDIDFADAPHFYWRRISLDDSRFAEVAEPMFHCQLGICGKIDCKSLSPKTKYAAYLVYKLTEILDDQYYRHPIGQIRQHTFVTVGKNITKNTVYLEPDYGKYVSKIFNEWKIAYENPEFDTMGIISAKERADRWIEVELGEFYIEKDEDGEVQIKLEEDNASGLKSRIVIQGIDIRPKY